MDTDANSTLEEDLMPWSPIPNELTRGCYVTVFREVRLVDLAHLDDVELMYPANWLWENTLINIAFRHRHVIENMATLDVLRKQ
ncbi:hypothetical protein FBUS_06541 [Fasciolopsis buskii]|uniref:Uncharacterized protein n=1 Tax=Fasciolopsis buskii TaxID=27845 RepID=A0A8E0S1Z4_9TREM|nr:hypothetical protein FBUS_06541 [Fasciolopsis buski]